ncbi:Uncharacterized protein dnm_000160 [Desulfonema magnum]|uniref:Uncharacterized protein n=1 Tax=Desulfonema magnum TaxID=45655 RepID=A0A975BF50_9BACT|nr:Uncharacterized protein dnm_000160 [Desulfonema magnum]
MDYNFTNYPEAEDKMFRTGLQTPSGKSKVLQKTGCPADNGRVFCYSRT